MLGPAIAVLSIAGCSGSAGDRAGAAATPSAAAGLGERGATPAKSPTQKVTKEITASYDFWAPSRNIGCYVGSDVARCDIVSKSWKPPAPPDDCELDFGGGVSVSQREEGTLTCAGDTVLGADETLHYGEAVKVGDFTCDSESAGVRCENTATGHGFTLSREKYTLF